MRKMFLSKIEKILNQERNIILSKSHDHEDIDIHGDETDEIQGKIIALVNSQLSSREKDKLKKIENALTKISEGTFGICEECGEEISEKRLIINPGFITCISCAEHLELLEKRNRR